jgi:hypothetical protein
VKKVVDLKAAAAAVQRKNYAALVLECFDKQQHADKRQQAEKQSEVQRKARNQF